MKLTKLINKIKRGTLGSETYKISEIKIGNFVMKFTKKCSKLSYASAN